MSCTAIQTLTAGPGAVVVGFRTIRIRAHRTARAMVRLNPIGRRLLRTLGSLPVVVSLAIRREGHTDTVMARIVRIRS
jgi:hypothetical protein